METWCVVPIEAGQWYMAYFAHMKSFYLAFTVSKYKR